MVAARACKGYCTQLTGTTCKYEVLQSSFLSNCLHLPLLFLLVVLLFWLPAKKTGCYRFCACLATLDFRLPAVASSKLRQSTCERRMHFKLLLLKNTSQLSDPTQEIGVKHAVSTRLNALRTPHVLDTSSCARYSPQEAEIEYTSRR